MLHLILSGLLSKHPYPVLSMYTYTYQVDNDSIEICCNMRVRNLYFTCKCIPEPLTSTASGLCLC